MRRIARLKSHRIGVIFSMIMVVSLAACGGNAQPSIVVIPPSATLTATATPTLTMTATVPPAVGQAVPTVVSQVATLPPLTATAGPSPTIPLAPSRSPAPATLTATSAPTQSGVSVEYFTTDTEVVRPGDNVTLFWGLRGATTAQIYRLNAQNERVWRWDVNTSGKITVATRTDERDIARFLLVGEARGVEVEQTLLIPMECPEVWFFEPPPDACPGAPAELTTEAEQTFEHGRMIWVANQDRIYVVFDDGLIPTWAQYPDNFAEGTLEFDEELVAPPGMQQPVRGFGLVWRDNPRVQARLGWATTPEIAFEGMFQADSIELSVATLYLRTRDGGILALDTLADEWTILPTADTLNSSENPSQ